MNRNIDINATNLNIVIELLKRYLPDTRVWAYGSRVNHTSRPQSDLDMVVFTNPEQQRAVYNLKEAFEESDLPFRVDLFVWNEIPEQFRENIKASHFILQAEPSGDLND